MAEIAERRPGGTASRRGWGGVWVAGAAGLASLTILAYLGLVAGAAVDPATLLLALGGGVLVFALHRMFTVVQAISGGEGGEPSVRADARAPDLAELREEKQRVLRAIKELDFDFELGKLSREDHQAVGDAYRLRAVEILRTLDARAGLHPGVVALVAELEGGTASAASAAAPPPVRGDAVAEHDAATPVVAQLARAPGPAGDEPVAGSESAAGSEAAAGAVCAACGTANDGDARFCKRCGRGLLP